YDVRREDGTLLAFVRRLSEALEPVAPSALASFPSMQERVLAAEEPVRALSDWFAEHLSGTSCTLVVDDLHYAATDPASIALIADVIERTSERIKWIIAARSDVGLPVATWIAYGRMDIPIGEDDLRFTTDEALSAAGQSAGELDSQEIESLRQLTEGWPVALTIALRTRTRSTDIRTASFGTRELIYRYLAEQVFAALSLPQRAFALTSCVLPSFDVEIAHALGATAEFLHEFRANVAFLNEVSPGQFRYHDLFRDFLETELRRSGEREWVRAMVEAAGILERRREHLDALTLYAKAHADSEIVEILERRGFALFESGGSDAIALAIAALSPQVRARNPEVLGLRAMVESAHGRFEIAEPDFRAAIERAEDPHLRVAIVSRYAIELVRQGRDCIALAEPYAADTSITAEERVPLLGTLATAYARADRTSEAMQTIELALGALTPRVDDEVRARLYHQAAYVFQYADPQRTARYAELALEVAQAHNLYGLAARAYSALYTVKYEADDAPGSLEALENMDRCARKAADSQARTFALMASYELAVDRGDDGTLERLELAIAEVSPTFTHARTEALLPAMAMRATWSGDFQRAYDMFEESPPMQSSPDRRALAWSQLAFYASACGLQEQSDRALERARGELHEVSAPALRSTLSLVYLALAHLVRGHDAASHRYLSEAEGTARAWPRARAFAQAIRTLRRVRLEQADAQAYRAELDRLVAIHLGGIARMLEALPSTQTQGEGYSQLTPAEREILQLLAAGASTKEIATRTGRSPHTVDTHIRAICRKLQCSGRREAVALAVGAGWVHA
ncbi:MAG TPA: LuxR C-terminal-related transcriptional regulator, partial [Candidatus Baltobacteraceae bacterium]|nr:LuxR C-terminal-related transcriptional regulator [Candidatus Baltobacteraceae bacterium]